MTSDRFTLLHTNDFHNALDEAKALKLQQMRIDLGYHGILLDAGDAVGSGNITFKRKGEPILDLMNRAGYEAMAVGNRDFHFSRIGFQSKLSRAGFPVLCANVRWRKHAEETLSGLDPGQTSLPVQPYLIIERGEGWRIAVFGITVPMITETMSVRYASAFCFDPPIAVAARMVPFLEKTYHPDVIIALTHIGIQQDIQLAQTVPGIHVILGGHSHTLLKEGQRIGECLIAQAGSHGKFVGRIALSRSKGPDRTLRSIACLEEL